MSNELKITAEEKKAMMKVILGIEYGKKIQALELSEEEKKAYLSGVDKVFWMFGLPNEVQSFSVVRSVCLAWKRLSEVEDA